METAIREAFEESKVSIKLTNYIGTFTQRSSDKLRIYYAFNAETADDPIVPEEETQKQNDEFISEVGWFSKEEISNINSEKMIDPIVYDILNSSIKGRSYPLEDFYDKKV
jgi:NADH pyrophosphatase NudC (nudix superfamily)